MSVKKCLGIALGILFLSFVFFFISQNCTHAEMRGMQSDHNHAVHMQKQAVSGPDVVVELKTTPIHLQTGSLAAILFSLKDHAGRPVKNLSVHHDRIMHVVIASQDFSVFAHIHPEEFSPVTPQMKKTAQLPVQYIFPRAGRYIIGVDFAVGEQLFSRHFLVEVSGE
ncbi:MAG: hypothetical protein MIO92_10915, partial [Methanosarcinaceae archaeon]|nr:hypothetical protein [Methanosarcinaceae archaeon]